MTACGFLAFKIKPGAHTAANLLRRASRCCCVRLWFVHSTNDHLPHTPAPVIEQLRLFHAVPWCGRRSLRLIHQQPYHACCACIVCNAAAALASTMLLADARRATPCAHPCPLTFESLDAFIPSSPHTLVPRPTAMLPSSAAAAWHPSRLTPPQGRGDASIVAWAAPLARTHTHIRIQGDHPAQTRTNTRQQTLPVCKCSDQQPQHRNSSPSPLRRVPPLHLCPLPSKPARNRIVW